MADLEEFAIGIPWTDERRAQWQARFDDVMPKVRSRARAEATQFVEQDVRTARDAGPDQVHLGVTRILLRDCVNDDADDALFRSLRATEKLRHGSTLEASPRLRVAAIFHESRAVFGWKPPPATP